MWLLVAAAVVVVVGMLGTALSGRKHTGDHVSSPDAAEKVR
jgi:hypothetical protein